ncbi:MAG: carboxypeptidase regulatory-like domain-containing protein [Pirellulales bacterium]|nr:carboxypeptidase regulatory-like domain-containing protein [Pirellulales bacterium]
MLDGKPVEGAAVGFMPEQGGPVASGSTDAEGYFQLSTMNQPGALVGKHQVTVIKTEHSGINPDGTIAPGGVKTKWLIPKKYGNAATSQLTAVVEPGGLDRVFELSSK